MTQEENRLSQLINKMVMYYGGDPKRIQHFIKVYSFAKLIGEMEGLRAEEQEILEVAALVHDIGIKVAEAQYDSSNGKLQEQLGPAEARSMLSELGYKEELIARVCYLVGHHHTYTSIDGLDYQILVEADFLVNIYEDELTKEAARNAYENIFRTESGKKLCREIYNL